MHYGIIAAGEGSRLVQEGVALPKPLVGLNGEPMIGRLINIFLDNNAESVSVIVNEQMTEVREYLERLAPTLPVPMRLVVKSTPSSMHSFHELSRVMEGDGRFVLTTVDTIFRPGEFSRYVAAFEAAGPELDGMMPATSFIDDEKPLYIDTDKEGFVTAFLDKPESDTRLVSGGIYGLTQKAFKVLDRCMERGVSRMRNFQREMLVSGLRLKAYEFDKIVDVDHAGDIATAEAFLNE